MCAAQHIAAAAAATQPAMPAGGSGAVAVVVRFGLVCAMLIDKTASRRRRRPTNCGRAHCIHRERLANSAVDLMCIVIVVNNRDHRLLS